MPLNFFYKKELSSIFGTMFRPIAKVEFLGKNKRWNRVSMIVDTGADYTLLPRHMVDRMGVDLNHECELLQTYGVGGGVKVWLLRKTKVRLGKWEREIPVGFLDSDEVPPLLGRHGFMETFETTFHNNHTLSFEEK